MPHYIVTLKLQTKFHNPNDKKTGACTFSPTCTDQTGAHHSVVMDAISPESIREWAASEGLHLTRIEEIFFIKSIPGEYDVPISTGRSADRSVDEREADGGSTRVSAANSVTTFSYTHFAGPPADTGDEPIGLSGALALFEEGVDSRGDCAGD